MLHETDIYTWQNGNFIVSLLELKFFCYPLVIKRKLRAENINCDSVDMRCISVNRPVIRPLIKYIISNRDRGGAVSFWKNTLPHSFKGMFPKSCGSSFCRNRRDVSPEDVLRRLRDKLTDHLQLHTTYWYWNLFEDTFHSGLRILNWPHMRIMCVIDTVVIKLRLFNNRTVTMQPAIAIESVANLQSKRTLPVSRYRAHCMWYGYLLSACLPLPTLLRKISVF